MSLYAFRREDNDEIVELPFEKMMEMDCLGCVTLEDGVVARRVRTAEKSSAEGKPPSAVEFHMVSDNLGVADHQLSEFREDARRNGFSVEFKEDPKVKGFYQCHCSEPHTWQRYIRHRGFFDKNGKTEGAALSPEQFARAQKAIQKKYGENLTYEETVVVSQ